MNWKVEFSFVAVSIIVNNLLAQSVAEPSLYRSDYGCGPSNLNTMEPPGPAECDPTSFYPCCSGIDPSAECWGTYGHFCDCPTCQDFQLAHFEETFCQRMNRLNNEGSVNDGNVLVDGRAVNCTSEGQFEATYCNNTHCMCTDQHGRIKETTATPLGQETSCGFDFSGCPASLANKVATCVFGMKVGADGCLIIDQCVDPCEDMSCSEYMNCVRLCETHLCEIPVAVCRFQIDKFCVNPANGDPTDPLIVNGEVRTCDAVTLQGCPEGFRCSLDTIGPAAWGTEVGFCCPDFDCVFNLGETYRGTKSTTAEGITCQEWTEMTPQRHQFTDDHQFFGGVEASENYCRNPKGQWSVEPWCYATTLPDGETDRKKMCGILKCYKYWQDFHGVLRHSSGLCLQIIDNWPVFGTTCHKRNQLVVINGYGVMSFPFFSWCLSKAGYWPVAGDLLTISHEPNCRKSFYSNHGYHPSESFETGSGSVCWALADQIGEDGLSDPVIKDIVYSEECYTIRQQFDFINLATEECAVEKSVCDESICEGAKCGFHGESACFVDPCGGCKPVFLDLDNKRVNCSDPPSKCERQRIRAERKNRSLRDLSYPWTFVPDCLEDGAYNTTQCHAEIELGEDENEDGEADQVIRYDCWCVDEAGNARNGSNPPNCDAWPITSVDVQIQLDQPYLFVKGKETQLISKLKEYLQNEFDIEEGTIHQLSVSETTNLKFQLKTKEQPPYDTSSVAYRIEAAVLDGKFLFLFDGRAFKGTSNHFIYNPFVPPTESGGGMSTTMMIIAILVPIVVIAVLGIIILRAAKKNRALSQESKFTRLDSTPKTKKSQVKTLSSKVNSNQYDKGVINIHADIHFDVHQDRDSRGYIPHYDHSRPPPPPYSYG